MSQLTDQLNEHIQALRDAGYPLVADSVETTQTELSKSVRDEAVLDASADRLMKAFPVPPKKKEPTEDHADAEADAKGDHPEPDGDETTDELKENPEGDQSKYNGKGQKPQPSKSDAMTDEMNGTEQEAATPGQEGPIEETNPDEATRQIVIDLLEELGLVEKVDDVVKAIANPQLKKNADDLTSLRTDVAKVQGNIEIVYEEIRKAQSLSGPVIRELGALSSESLAKQMQIDSLKKSLETIKDPLARQSVENEIARLSIETIHSKR